MLTKKDLGIPWEVVQNAYDDSTMILAPSANDGRGGHVLTISHTSFAREQDIEHADFIILACNQHHALVAEIARKDVALNWINDNMCPCDAVPSGCDDDGCMQKIKAAQALESPCKVCFENGCDGGLKKMTEGTG